MPLVYMHHLEAGLFDATDKVFAGDNLFARRSEAAEQSEVGLGSYAKT